jgi:hypothetical protein
LVFCVPACVIEISPAQQHRHLLELFKAGIPPIRTVGEPGTQGVVTGMHGIGVKTPSAAAVAAATMGLAIDVQVPNDGILSIGAKSMIVAAGVPSAFVMFTGSTIKLPGAAPKLHLIIAPIFTN